LKEREGERKERGERVRGEAGREGEREGGREGWRERVQEREREFMLR
jgi:hypothetical protein